MTTAPGKLRNDSNALADYLEGESIPRSSAILLTGRVDGRLVWALQRKRYLDITYAMDRGIPTKSRAGVDPIYVLLEGLSDQNNPACNFFKRFDIWHDGGEFQFLDTWQKQSDYLRRVKNYLLIGGLFAILSSKGNSCSGAFSDPAEIHGRLGLRFEMRAIISSPVGTHTYPNRSETLSIFQYW